jgi:hypothetical protein
VPVAARVKGRERKQEACRYNLRMALLVSLST